MNKEVLFVTFPNCLFWSYVLRLLLLCPLFCSLFMISKIIINIYTNFFKHMNHRTLNTVTKSRRLWLWSNTLFTFSFATLKYQDSRTDSTKKLLSFDWNRWSKASFIYYMGRKCRIFVRSLYLFPRCLLLLQTRDPTYTVK